MEKMETKNPELQHSPGDSQPANLLCEESTYTSSVGDIISSSAVTVKEMVLSRVSVTGHLDGAPSVDGPFSSANTTQQGEELDSGGSKMEEEIYDDNNKGVMETVGNFISPTVTHHVKEVINIVASHGEGDSGELIADAAARFPETDEASILINSIIRD